MSAGEMFVAMRQALNAQDSGFEASGELVSQHTSLSNALLIDDREQQVRLLAYAAMDGGRYAEARRLFLRADRLDRLQRHETERSVERNLSAREFMRLCNGAVDRVRDAISTLMDWSHRGAKAVAGGKR